MLTTGEIGATTCIVVSLCLETNFFQCKMFSALKINSAVKVNKTGSKDKRSQRESIA